MKIGYYFGGKADVRNIIGKVKDFEYIQIYDPSKFYHFLLKKINKLTKKSYSNLYDVNFYFNDYNFNKVDLIHLWNTVSYGKTPWISTFETILPRYRKTLKNHHGRDCGFEPLKHDLKIKKAIKAISEVSCKKIIALSKCNLEMQKELVSFFPEYRDIIVKKLIFLHPPQELIVNSYEEKNVLTDDIIKFIFVGGLFFTKGGEEILDSFISLKQENSFNFHLTIISDFRLDKYATMKNKEDIERVKNLIKKNNDWITYFKHLPNTKVIELMKNSHIGLLPTHADTFGYSMLEFQAAGCSVISTDVRALPEINNEKTGWIINVPKNKFGEALYVTEEDRKNLSRTIYKGLKRIIKEIMNNKDLIRVKGENAIKNISLNHSPLEYSKKLKKIYLDELN